MPKDLLDDKTKFPPVVRVPVDGDEASGANFELPYQQLADRTAFLAEETLSLGVRRVRRVDDFVALRAVALMQPFDVRWVVASGLYWYDATSSDGEDLPWAVKPTLGGGVWRHVDGARRGRIERAFHAYNPFFIPPLETTNNTWTDAGLAVTLRGAAAGERVRIHLNGDFRVEGGAGIYRVLVIDGAGGVTELPEMIFGMFASAGFQPRTVAGLHQLAASGDVAVKVQFQSSGTSTKTQIWGPATLLAELVRF
ncbi:MAG: hypothetical protein HYV09_03340 [Deltaproteobacteria bacterium]|nr:hypothetical protein [Deltaproteobacteria bacterium]